MKNNLSQKVKKKQFEINYPLHYMIKESKVKD